MRIAMVKPLSMATHRRSISQVGLRDCAIAAGQGLGGGNRRRLGFHNLDFAVDDLTMIFLGAQAMQLHEVTLPAGVSKLVTGHNLALVLWGSLESLRDHLANLLDQIFDAHGARH